MGNILDFDDTSTVAVPPGLLDQIIGQEEAVRLAKVIAKQRRHLLLVGPPGTGKSMIAQAITSLLTRPHSEISVLHNPLKPERPFLEVRLREQIEQQNVQRSSGGLTLRPEQAPPFVAERLGYRCRSCGFFSDPDASLCPQCAGEKFRQPTGPFDDLLMGLGEAEREDAVHTTRQMRGKEELVVFERVNASTIRALDSKEMERLHRPEGPVLRNILLTLERPLFVQATGASETELLGDVRHDPYGGHPQIGTLPYARLVPGAVHEAHEGVLFIDELVSIGRLQRHLLTAMQEKRFAISGRNASSTGASVKVPSVPSDFILVAAVNTTDVHRILPPLRSRISGNGYELLVNAVMPDTDDNQKKLAQFVSQEVRRDGRIPHATRAAVSRLISEARRRAKAIDHSGGLSLRLRALSGIVKTAGDWAVVESAPLIEEKHILIAIEKGKPVEEQIHARYGSSYRAALSDIGLSRPVGSENEIG